MLDEADFIARFDKEDALGVVAGQPDQLRHACDVPERISSVAGYSSIVVAGMGGSALPTEFIKNWLGDRLSVPVEIVRDYTLPDYVGADTLVVCSSYSGNTEEELSALSDAQKRGSKIVVMAAGGKLADAAREQNLPLFLVPSGLQPRLAVLYGVRALAQLLEATSELKGLVAELEAAASWVKAELKPWQSENPTTENVAKQIAQDVVGHAVVVYGGPALRLPTMKWKIDFNENGKNLAFYNSFPELSHNEFIGWAHPEEHGLKVIELRSELDHPQIVRRFDVTNKLLSNRFAPIQVQAKGETKLQQILWTLILGDFVSVYVAFLNGIDPTPVPLVEKMKQELV